jgi:hypothetical protein
MRGERICNSGENVAANGRMVHFSGLRNAIIERGLVFGRESKREKTEMRYALFALATIAALAAAPIGTANAEVIFIGPHAPYYAYGGDCRVVIRHYVNRWGEYVTDRRRSCH